MSDEMTAEEHNIIAQARTLVRKMAIQPPHIKESILCQAFNAYEKRIVAHKAERDRLKAEVAVLTEKVRQLEEERRRLQFGLDGAEKAGNIHQVLSAYRSVRRRAINTALTRDKS